MQLPPEKKVEVLLHFENQLRQDWRHLHRLRILTVGLFLGLATTVVGWFAARSPPDLVPSIKAILLLFDAILTGTAILTLAWFGSSLNTLKRSITNIEEALGLFREDDGVPIFDAQLRYWGQRERWHWGKAVFLSVGFGLLYLFAIVTM